jgi:Brf1-like TBP-binding domain
MEARAKAIQEGNTEYLTSGALDDPFSNSEKQATKWRLQNTPANTTERKAELNEMYSKLEEKLQQNRKSSEGQQLIQQEGGESSSSSSTKSQHHDNQNSTCGGQEDDVTILSEKAKDAQGDEELKPAAQEPQEQIVVHNGPNIGVVVTKEWKEAYPNKNGKPIVLPDHSTAEERLTSTVATEGTLNTVEWKTEMPESMESEFDCIFRSDEEESQKEAIFNKINKEYLVQQERKESERLNAEAAEKHLEDDDVKQAEQHARYQNSRSSRSKSGKNNKRSSNDANLAVLDGTTEEHLLAAMNSRKISRKINYDALSSIFDDDGSLGNVDASIASVDGDDMYAMI